MKPTTTKKTVVILLSDKRSGSTMFQRELCKHPDVQTVSYSPHTYLETHHWLKAAVMLGVPPELFSEGKVYKGYGSRQNARTYMEDCIHKNVPDFEIPTQDKELIFKGWEALCSRFSQPVFFEKSPQFLAHWGCLELLLNWIEQTDYQIKVIGLVRNPLAVLYSAQALFHTEPSKRQYGWVEIHENLFKFKSRISADQFLLCRYEDITQRPVESFTDICRFIDIADNKAIGTGVHSSSENKWTDDPFFTIQLADPVKVVAKRLGYADDELVNLKKPRQPLLYRVSRKINGVLRLMLDRFKNRLVIPTILRLKQVLS